MTLSLRVMPRKPHSWLDAEAKFDGETLRRSYYQFNTEVLAMRRSMRALFADSALELLPFQA